MPELTNAQVLLVKNSGGADLDFLAIHLYHPEAPESQNNQVVTPVRLYSKPGMDAPPRRKPSPRGKGGSPPRPALWGRGGSPPRPAP